MTMQKIASKREKGFTLIELVMVIVILGILAAFALPRFADFGGDAREASIKAAAGAVRSASSIAHSRWLADGSPSVEEDTDAGTPASGGTVTLEGSSIAMSTAGYPQVSALREAAQLSDEYFVAADGTVSLDGAKAEGTTPETATGTCSFEYDPSDGSVVLGTLADC